MNVELAKISGAALAAMRREMSLTQTQLAAKLECPQSVISKIERGERSLKVYEQYAYAEALGIPVAILVSRVGSALKSASNK